MVSRLSELYKNGQFFCLVMWHLNTLGVYEKLTTDKTIGWPRAFFLHLQFWKRPLQVGAPSTILGDQPSQDDFVCVIWSWDGRSQAFFSIWGHMNLPTVTGLGAFHNVLPGCINIGQLNLASTIHQFSSFDFLYSFLFSILYN